MQSVNGGIGELEVDGASGVVDLWDAVLFCQNCYIDVVRLLLPIIEEIKSLGEKE